MFFRAFSTDDWFARYFNPQSQWRQADAATAIDEELRAGRVVWLETTAADYFAQNESAWLQDHSRSADRRELIKPGRRLRFVRLVTP